LCFVVLRPEVDRCKVRKEIKWQEQLGGENKGGTKEMLHRLKRGGRGRRAGFGPS